MKNITLLYFIKALNYSYFWLGIWVLYYKTFGGFAAVGILETVMIVTTTLFEIPTGAIGDLLGKRKTLIIGFLVAAFTQVWMGFASSLLDMVIILTIMNIGSALISGTFEAMVYDSLKEIGQEHRYNKINSHMTSIYLAALAICGIVGGPLYLIWHGLPFVLTGIAILIGAILCYFLVEPKIDSEKFTLKNYIRQNINGFKQLFGTKILFRLTSGLLLVALVLLIMGEGVNDMLAVVYGFNEIQLGILASALALTGALASYLAGKISEQKLKKAFVFMIVLYSLSLLATPVIAALLGAGMLFVRAIISPILYNEISTTLNENIESKNRATALSTFSMLKGVPYAFLIYAIGYYADIYPIQKITFVLGVLLILVAFYNFFVQRNKMVKGQNVLG